LQCLVDFIVVTLADESDVKRVVIDREDDPELA
jgi:hypothetical protein